MKLSKSRQKNSRIKSKSGKKFITIDEQNKKMKSEESESKERFNTISDIRNPSKKRVNKKEKENYYEKLSKKKEEVLLKITRKINKNKEKKIYKDYPNLIKGVLGQAVYNNMTNNTNYNEYIRYKPITDIFNDQSNIPTRKITIENTNSLNISFNSKSDLVKKEKEKNDIDTNAYNYYNIENEFKLNQESIKSRKNETLIKSGKSISPILSNNYYNENKKDSVSEYINIKSNDKNERGKIDNNNNIINNIEIYPKKTVDIKEKLEVEKIENFNILGVIIKNNDNNNYLFKNEEEMWKYIKNKMTEEKDKEYNDNKLKYNYFTLIKKFHGKILYEIGLENNLAKINYILEKENVKVENEPILLVKKNSIDDKSNTDVDSDNEIKMLKIKIDKINKENEQLKENINIMKGETDKLNKTINLLNDKLKLYMKDINDKNNEINEYQNKLKEINLNIGQNKEDIIFEIIKNDFFDIINISNKKFKENDIIYLIEHFAHEYKNISKNEEKKKNDEINYKRKEKEKEKEKKKENNIKLDKKEEKIEDKKAISNNVKDKINLYNKNVDNYNNIEKEENIPKKIFLVSNTKTEETIEEKMKREERMNKALKRIKNKRKSDAEKNKLRKSENIKDLSSALETQLQKGEGKKLYVDLEYEKELEKERENEENEKN